jgi:hypothetical protein
VSIRKIRSVQIVERKKRNAVQDLLIYDLLKDLKDKDILKPVVNRDRNSVESVLLTLPLGSKLETLRGINTLRKQVRELQDRRSILDRVTKRVRT